MTDIWTSWIFWICIVAILAVAAFSIVDEYTDGFDGFMYTLGAFFAALCAFFAVSGLLNWWLPTTDITNRYDLVVMNDKSMLSGQVVLGSGSVSEGAGYSFYIDGGAWQQYLVLPGRNALVYQDVKPGEKPWVVLFNGCHIWGHLAPCFWNGTQVNEVHVPPGTIKPSLNLDAR